MDQVAALPNCPQCHIQVRTTDYFCFNCGKNLQEKPMDVSILKQIVLYIGCIILVPFGFIWGFRYLRQAGDKQKIVGIVCIVITLLATIFVTIYTINFINTVQDQISDQLKNVGY